MTDREGTRKAWAAQCFLAGLVIGVVFSSMAAIGVPLWTWLLNVPLALGLGVVCVLGASQSNDR